LTALRTSRVGVRACNTGFPRVAADQQQQRFVVDRPFAGIETALGVDACARFQPCVLGVAGNADNLHPIHEARRDVGIRRRDEHHAGEVLLGLEIVIEGMVLFGSENLKQHRRQIAAEIGADLVHVVCWGRPKIEGEVLSDAPALSQC